MTTRTMDCPECGEDLTFEIGWDEQPGSGIRFSWAKLASQGKCKCLLGFAQLRRIERRVVDAYDAEGPDVD